MDGLICTLQKQLVCVCANNETEVEYSKGKTTERVLGQCLLFLVKK